MNNFAIIVAVVLTAGASYLFHYWDVTHIEAQNQIQVAAAAASATAECKKTENVTTEASHEYEAEINNLAGERNAVSVRANAPASGLSAPAVAAGYLNSSIQPGHVFADEIGRSFLYDYSAEAEKYRIQLKACQKFVNDTWAVENK